MGAVAAGLDPAYLEALYEQWKTDPGSLDVSWQMFFQGFDLASCDRSCVAAEQARDQSRVASLIYNYRDQGHRIARTNPLHEPDLTLTDLELSSFGFEDSDLERVFDTGHLGGPQRAPLREIVEILRRTYCGSVGVEYLQIQDVGIRRWLQEQMEPGLNRARLTREERLQILELLIDAELFETFIQGRYLGQKRFSLEGAESLIPLLHWIVDNAPDAGIEEIVIGMAHRGRLNVLANLLDKSYSTIFSEFEDNYLTGSVAGDADVKYHKGFGSVHVSHRDGRPVHLGLTANPSHLEVVDPVVLGRVRAKQRQRGDMAERVKVVPVLVHGDAAFAGQGIVAECFNLSRLDGYWVGGSIHVVVNNQIGFTTLPGEARSSLYATDVAKIVEAPIFHVNGDDPEAVVHVADLALRYRQEFRRDVVIDLLCYRRHGHQEIDEPGFTQPGMYREIREHPTVRRLYTHRLLDDGVLSPEEAEATTARFQSRLEQALDQARTSGEPEPAEPAYEALWEGLDEPYSDATIESGVAHERLVTVARALTEVPEGFSLNPKVARHLPARREAVEQRGEVDWTLAEGLCFGSLLLEGTPVRLSGQDSARGTFSQRHAIWHDSETEALHVPLNALPGAPARFCVYNSPLSEASVLGFDYGYSLSEPRMLVLWEAQFGDFANGAQVIIDQFLVAAQAKWQRGSGLVMLLPHGYEGQGPEHSNAYLERYLAACASDNIQVCNPSTPAQLFHVLRRQVLRPFRRPLVLMTPKSLLRHPRVRSPVGDLIGGRFDEVLDDPSPPEQPERLVLCSGKLYYDLIEGREAAHSAAALVRVEQLYPFPEPKLADALARHAAAGEIVWAQEEPRNRGAWSYVEPRLRSMLPGRTLRYAGRPASASPATGSLHRHREEQDAVVKQALGEGEER